MLRLPLVLRGQISMVHWLEDTFAAPLPPAESRQFSVLVAQFEGETAADAESLLVENLRKRKGVTVLRAQRKLRVRDAVDTTKADLAAVARAQGWLKDSGADLVVWGYLKPGPEKQLQVYAATAAQRLDPQLLNVTGDEFPAEVDELLQAGLELAGTDLGGRLSGQQLAQMGEALPDGASVPPLAGELPELAHGFDRQLAVWKDWDWAEDSARQQAFENLADAALLLVELDPDPAGFVRAWKFIRDGSWSGLSDEKFETKQFEFYHRLAALAAGEKYRGKVGDLAAFTQAAKLYDEADREWKIPEALQGAPWRNMKLGYARVLGALGRVENTIKPYEQALRKYKQVQKMIPVEEKDTVITLLAETSLLRVDLGLKRERGTYFAQAESELRQIEAHLREKSGQELPNPQQLALALALTWNGYFCGAVDKLKEGVAMRRRLLAEGLGQKEFDEAFAQFYLADALCRLADVEAGEGILAEAETAAQRARQLDEAANRGSELGDDQLVLGWIRVLRMRTTPEPGLRQEARQYLEQAQRRFKPASVAGSWIDCMALRARIRADHARQERDGRQLQAALNMYQQIQDTAPGRMYGFMENSLEPAGSWGSYAFASLEHAELLLTLALERRDAQLAMQAAMLAGGVKNQASKADESRLWQRSNELYDRIVAAQLAISQAPAGT